MNIKEFNKLMYDAKLKKYAEKLPKESPERLRSFVTAHKYSDTNENNLAVAIIDYVHDVIGGVSFRISNEGRVREPKDSTYRYGKVMPKLKRLPSTLPNGISDIYIEVRRVYGGTQAIWCELKNKKGFQQEDQKKYENYIKNIGGCYFIADSIESFFANMRKIQDENNICMPLQL